MGLPALRVRALFYCNPGWAPVVAERGPVCGGYWGLFSSERQMSGGYWRWFDKLTMTAFFFGWGASRLGREGEPGAGKLAADGLDLFGSRFHDLRNHDFRL